MEFMKKVTQRLQRVRRFGRLLGEEGLINTTDLLVATGTTVVLAAGVGSAAISSLSEAKYGKAQPDGQAMATAISQFYKDTGKWPGQAEHAGDISSGSVGPKFVVTSTNADFFPEFTVGSTDATAVAETACGNSSLEGFPGVTIEAGGITASNVLDINKYLVENPGSAYPNWKGPYLTGGSITSDPWDRAWVFNLQALYCAESVGDAASTQTLLGNAWALSAGNNRTLTTRFRDGGLDDSGDDAGANLGKLVQHLTVQ